MTRLRTTLLGVVANCLVLLIGAPVVAAPIPIVNPSFESPVQPCDGCFNSGVITGWSAASSTGVWNPAASQVAVVPDGDQIGYSNGGPISQVLGDVLAANTMYVLSVDALRRIDGCCGSPVFTINLLAGATVLATASLDYSTLPAGTIQALAASYTAGGADPHLGELLQIQFATAGLQSDFDNVRLNASPVGGGVPEPGSLLLLGSGLAALSGVAWRRRPQK